MAINYTRYERRATSDEPLAGRHLRNKKILITAGPTWVAIDSVRVVSNIASGQTGIMLAERLQRLGAKVTLLLGPVEACCLNKKIRLLRFKFFDELLRDIKKELKARKYDSVIHSAAVSDYRPRTVCRQKVRSDRKDWKIDLVATPKIIDAIREAGRSLFLVGFKFQPQLAGGALVKEARELLKKKHLDLVVANSTRGGRYLSYIVTAEENYGPLFNKEKMAQGLVKTMERHLCKD